MRLPSGYKELLEISYGDYMKFPPVEQRGCWHGFEAYPDIPYKEYYKERLSIRSDDYKM